MLRTLPFSGTCAAGSTAVLVSKRIRHPYSLIRIRASFAPGCEGLLSLRFYLSYDDEVPAAGPPSGVNILQELGATDYLIGDDQDRELQWQLNVPDSGTYLKVYAVNTDAFPHTISALLTLDLNNP